MSGSVMVTAATTWCAGKGSRAVWLNRTESAWRGGGVTHAAASMVSSTVNMAGPYVTVACAARDTREGRGGFALKEEAFLLSGRCVSVRV